MHWVAARVPGCERGWTEYQSLGVEHKGEIVAGVVLHGWEPETGIIELSGAAEDPRWMTREVMRKVFHYVFEELCCQMIVARQDPSNDRAIRAWKALGANEIIIPRLRGRSRDGSIITFTDDAWRQSKFRRSSDGR